MPTRKKKKNKPEAPRFSQGQTFRIVLPEKSEYHETGLPCILINTAEPVFMSNFTYVKFEGLKRISEADIPIFKKVHDWDQSFIIPKEFWNFLEKRNIKTRGIR